jgi:hypothetical protein
MLDVLRLTGQSSHRGGIALIEPNPERKRWRSTIEMGIEETVIEIRAR